MKHMEKKNSGFSLIELIIAMAVLAFLMLAVSSFMGSSVMQNKKVKVDVKMQTQSQETYSLFSDAIMQASDIIMVGYEASDDSLIDFSKDGEKTTATLTKHFYVKDKDAAQALISDPGKYGIEGSVSETEIVYFKDVDKDKKIYVKSLRIESSVPIDMNQTEGKGNANIVADQTLMNDLTGEEEKISCEEKTAEDGTKKKVYSTNDTLVSTFCFEENSLYYGRKYAFMSALNDPLDMNDSTSRREHLYNKYFSYNTYESAGVGDAISGCVATINADDGTIGIDFYYHQSNMQYTTNGRVNTRNSYVLKPRK